MQQVGVIGMAVMGKNLALNLNRHGYSVSVFSISKQEMKTISEKYQKKTLVPTSSWQDFVNSLKRPRKIIIMIKAGAPVDQTINCLKPLLNKGDILIDGGNSWFQDTNRRFNSLNKLGIAFIGMGISGGEQGALAGPSMMPGGQQAAYEQVAPMLKAIAAKNDQDYPCVNYIGPEGAGHYVKMVHNGIEYGIMQLLCEVYDILRTLLKLNNSEVAKIFSGWNHTDLESYLLEITVKILCKKDQQTGQDLIDVILNQAEYKGTGNWMLEDAVNLGAPITVIAESVFARFISGQVISNSNFKYKNSSTRVPNNFINIVQNSLILAQFISYGQGLQQLQLASDRYHWHLDLASITQIWENGCIIRSSMLTKIQEIYSTIGLIGNLFTSSYFGELITHYILDLRQTVMIAQSTAIPTPALSAALNYLESIFNTKLPANLLQAQRDYFGAHSYKRLDRKGIFHTNWYPEM